MPKTATRGKRRVRTFAISANRKTVIGCAPGSKMRSFGSKLLTPACYLRSAQMATGVVLIGSVFWWLQFSTPSICCGDFDGYYHIKWSQLLWNGLRNGHFAPAFTWLPLTTLNPSRYADQHFLYHILLIPFTWFGDLRVGAKLATALFGTVAVLSLYWLVLRYRIHYPVLWLLALLGCSWLFYARLNMTKAQSISILFIVVGIVLLFERRYIWLLPTAFLYVWTYNLFVILGVLSLIWVGVVWWSEQRTEWRPLLWTGLGTATGFVIHPYFPNNVRLFFEHIIAKSGQASMPAGVGFEWYSFSSWAFLKSSLIASTAMIVGYIAFGYGLSRGDRIRLQRPLLFLLFSSVLLLITIRSIRFMEYWPPFAVLFAAFALQAVWDSECRSPHLLRQAGENLHSVPAGLDDVEEPKGKRNGGPRRTQDVIAIALVLAILSFYSLCTTRAIIDHVTVGPEHYRAGAEWLRNNVPRGTLIYDVNWSDFPKLFFYDASHNYVSGLDSLYLLDQHPELAQLNERLSRREEEDPAAAIRSLFGASNPAGVSYIFVGDRPAPPSPEWLRYIMKTGKFQTVYEDNECMILHVLD